MVIKYIPSRGDIVWLNFEPQQGKEIKKIRPAITISPQKYNAKTGLALFMPISSKIKNYPFAVKITLTKINGEILCDQIRSLDWRERKATFITEISEDLIAQVLDKFNLLIS